MTHLFLLLSLFHPSHRAQFIRETLTELKQAAAEVGDYEHNPPLLTSPADDSMYVVRAEADIQIVLTELNKYKHHHVSEQDVETAVSQLERDLEDIPEGHFPQDQRSTI